MILKEIVTLHRRFNIVDKTYCIYPDKSSIHTDETQNTSLKLATV